MKRLYALLAGLLLWAGTSAPPAFAQQETRSITLASSFDLDGEAADADQVVLSTTITDTATYTITADPDICRLVDVSVTDADSSISAGTLTIDGFDCWGYPLRATYALNGGSGVRTGTVADFSAASPKKASGAYFSDVTSVANGVVTGEGVGDVLTVGYTTNSPKGWVLYGVQKATPTGRRYVDVFDVLSVPRLVKNGAAQTDAIAVTAGTSPFINIAVGDLLLLRISGELYPRVVATKTDNDTITLNASAPLPAAGITFNYKRRFFSTDPQDGWIGVLGWDVVTFVTDVDANASTGGVVTSVECAVFSVSAPPNSEVQVEVDTATVASASTGTDVSSVDLRLNPQYTHCRTAIKFGTGDDTDTAPEDIDIAVGFRK